MTVRKKPTGRFNLFDLILLLLLAAVIVAACFFFIPSKSASNGRPAQAVFILSGVRSDLARSLSAGDTVYDAGGNTVLGKILRIESAPDTLKIAPKDGAEELVASYPPNTILSLTLTVRLDHAVPVKNGFAVGSLEFLTGESARIRTADFSAVGVCRSVVFFGEEESA